MGYVFGPPYDVPMAVLVRLLLARAMKIWDRDCGPFRPNFAFFVILGQVGNPISLWGKGPGGIEYAQESVALEF